MLSPIPSYPFPCFDSRQLVDSSSQYHFVPLFSQTEHGERTLLPAASFRLGTRTLHIPLGPVNADEVDLESPGKNAMYPTTRNLQFLTHVKLSKWGMTKTIIRESPLRDLEIGKQEAWNFSPQFCQARYKLRHYRFGYGFELTTRGIGDFLLVHLRLFVCLLVLHCL